MEKTDTIRFMLVSTVAITVGILGLYTRSIILENFKLKDEILTLSELREVERKGRIKVQQRKNEEVRKEQRETGIVFQSIGVIETPFPDRRGTPRQPILVSSATGRIRFNKNQIQYEHYRELEEFSHVWVLFLFNFNTNVDSISTTTMAKIKPPRLHGKKVGCLSTRSPHRPNPIGLSVCEVVAVDKDGITIKCIDFVDGTIVLDVKPYIPYDIIPSDLPLCMIPDGVKLSQLKVPSWIYESDIQMKQVKISDSAKYALQELCDDRILKHFNRYDDVEDFLIQVLRQDIRKLGRGKGGGEDEGAMHICHFDVFTLEVSHTDECIIVNRLL